MSRLPVCACLLLVLLNAACSDEPAGGPTDDDDSSGSGSGGSGGAGAGCDSAGKPEMTGPITGLAASYARGAAIDIGVPVDEDTLRVTVGVYEVGSELFLGGSAEETSPGSTQTVSLFAGTADGPTGTFYLSVELCSVSLCTPPVAQNSYQRADRFAPTLANGETYQQTREDIGGDTMPEICPTTIPVQSFLIE